ncbi:D-glycero-beta-D-manno-heptose-7-phosphate kinase [Pararhodospirillum oryzae]|uniref:Bifunctional protein HldE n=1 Tax=Pararhodospirillum oryzae TaxID=478448 RepID=A0A512H836_9PROT|nr:D-glycero-beta-D-manno-heptose-7-phosphate kinase [Pararhodospirillum oryzae]GEO81560.1 bifunctional protein HldE [Pararhodospirillum oryzae]
MISSSLADLVPRLAAARVLCVGDVMLDRFVHGSVERISPEAPIPVLRVRESRMMLGGAGNVVRNVVALGGACTFLSVTGSDPAGAEVARLLAEEPRVTPGLVQLASRRTSVKTRYLAGGQQLLRADEETVAPLDAADALRLIDKARQHLEPGTGLVLSDYGKGVLSEDVTRALIALGREKGCPVIVDPKGRDFSRYRGATVLTPNRKELAEATGLPTDTDTEVAAACNAVIGVCGVDAVLATRSQDGMTLVTAGGGVVHLPAEAREVFDVSGAGDTVIATLVGALSVGAPLEDACRLANLAAGIVVGRVGTATVPGADLMAAIHHQDLSASEARVVETDEAAERVARWRRQGLRIGFTNGCFDLLHPGHVSLLRQARATCDRLIVGLNSDASVRRLKGPTRPVQSEMARATVLASLAGVDLVVIFTEDTPLALIERLMPDILVKGADYTEDQVVGGAVVKAAGGRVVLARLEDGHSTTATLARVHGSPTGGKTP